MELKAVTKTVYDMLSVKKRYIVPGFKRGYTWTLNEVSEFWLEIVSNVSITDNIIITKERFIGSIVLVDDNKSNNILIIDGHQRLLTITILFAALVEAFKTAGRIDLSIALQGLITDKQKVYRISNEYPCNYLQQTVQKYEKTEIIPECDIESNIRNTFEFFRSKLTELSTESFQTEGNTDTDKILKLALLEAIRDQVLKNIMICITVSNENDAFTILGTMNAKVPTFTPADFIKNDVVKKLNTKGLSLDAEGKWMEIKQILNSRVDKDTLDTFLMDYWPSKYEYLPSEKLYSSFKSRVPQNPESLSKFIDSLITAANSYIKISDPMPSDFRQQEEREVYNSLSALELFRANSSKVLLLALLDIREKNLITLSDFIKVLSCLENFHFIATAICSVHIPGLERIYSNKAIAFRRSQSIKESKDIMFSLMKELSSLLPDFQTFRKALSKIYFVDGKPRYKKLIQYIFRRWEAYLRVTNELEMAEITLEHIMPQASDNPNVGMLGNLLPLAGQLNHTAGDKDFLTKMNFYRRSQFKVVMQFVEKYHWKEDWDERDIFQRTNELAKILYYEIFKC